MLHKSERQAHNPSRGFLNHRFWFGVFLGVLVIDRTIALFHFGFAYTDIDQTVFWNGALDYSNGIFREPYFYGQAYNYMLEALLAAPFVAWHVPVYKALPVVTAVLSVLPFLVLAIFLQKRKRYFWALLALAMPVLLPLPYSLLAGLPRGFVQAFMFIPLLYIPLFAPDLKRSVTWLYVAAGFCLLVNPSSILVVLPIGIYVFSYHVKSPSFYVKALLLLPFFAVDFLSKHYYKIYPEKVMHKVLGLTLDGETFLASFTNPRLFEHVFPFYSGWGMAYPIVFAALAAIAIVGRSKRPFLFIVTIIALLLLTFAVPKIQEDYIGAGVFFSSSRVYLSLPLLLVISLFLLFKERVSKPIFIYGLALCTGAMLVFKNIGITSKIEKAVAETTFPVAKTEDLIARANDLNHLAHAYQLDLLVHANAAGWQFVFDAYAYNPLVQTTEGNFVKTISVNLNGDRRTWLYADAQPSKNILLNGYNPDSLALGGLEYKILNQNQVVILNNSLALPELFQRLNLNFGGPLR